MSQFLDKPTSRRSVLAGGAAAAAAVGLGATLPASAAAVGARPSRVRPNIVLVHGAWADGSSWSGVLARLLDSGLTAVAVQLPLRSVAGDADVVRRAIDNLGGPVLLVGHSYGGAVISAAGSDRADVAGLVYVAAFAPDRGESIGQLVGQFPPPPVLGHVVADAIGDLLIDRAAFPSVFAPDVPVERARVYAATQGALNAAAFGETLAVAPAWRQKPTWYQVSADDQVVNPDLERFLAKRMSASTLTLRASHASLISHPDKVARLITAAARSL